MTGRLVAIGVFLAAAASAQNYAERFWFEDGAGVELHTQSTGTSGTTELTGGGTIGWDEVSRDDLVGRFVTDRNNKTVFSYRLEAHRGPEPDEITIRLKPSDSPTVAAVREFAGVKYGQEVKIEILSNPNTGEHVYDILRPVEGPSPGPGHRSTQAVSIPKLVVNGQPVTVKSSWLDGQQARLYIPGHGAYFLVWQSKPNYRMAGYVDKNRLIFLMENVYVEMTFPGNVLGSAPGGPVWVYHDAGYLPEHGGATCLLDSFQ
jgi:hypothetical protein